ncbi:MAG: hypothetical protein QMD13_03830 [Candidatus Bathyarchaeia archaeon]|nr:hypothetical protein [Candidatus Bathyarchaeia archaeon]
MKEDFEYRYPIKRTRYTQSVSRLLPHRIGQIFKELGFKTWMNPGQTNGVDLKVYDDEDQLILVVEILNWSPVCALPHERKNNIITNLSGHNCKKLLIYTCLENESILEDLSSYEVSLLKIGYQILPWYFYEFFLEKDQIESRRVDSRETKEDIKSKIIEYLKSFSIEIHALTFENREITVTGL